MGGGKKKTTLRKMEKARSRKSAQKESKSSKPSRHITEKKTAGIVSPDSKSEKVLSELKKIRALTPYTVASRFNLRLGVARDLLEELERRRVIEYISGSKNLKIYKLAN
ncbi:hypothetical protein KAW11_00865 [Candidatus Bathyarchaeota archaeon]|nr:hypothetical protein [Candidatus Bathyarchaeota archaeon]